MKMIEVMELAIFASVALGALSWLVFVFVSTIL